jgi:hypothetical protein
MPGEILHAEQSRLEQLVAVVAFEDSLSLESRTWLRVLYSPAEAYTIPLGVVLIPLILQHMTDTCHRTLLPFLLGPWSTHHCCTGKQGTRGNPSQHL